MICPTRVCAVETNCAGASLFWAEEPSSALRASLANMGQLEPVLARLVVGGWQVLSGYKRTRALADLGVDIWVREIPWAADPVEDGLLYLHANIHRTLDDALRLRALRYFQTWLGLEELTGRIAPLLGLEPRSGAWRRFTAWLELPLAWDAPFLAGHLPLAAGPALAGLGQADLAALEPYFLELKWSHSRAVQWLTFLTETARREGVRLDELLQRHNAAGILAGDISPQDKLHRLFTQARALRYPSLSALERRFDSLRKELLDASHWELIPSEGFETDVVELRLRAHSAADVRAAAQALDQAAASDRLPEFFAIAR